MGINNFSPKLIEDADSKWEDLCNAVQSSGLRLPEDGEFNSTTRKVLCLSDFIARSCIRHPAILIDLIETGNLQQPYGVGAYHKKLRRLLSGTKDIETLTKVLRHFRRREMIRIAWRDLAGWADLSQTMIALTALAEACIEQALLILSRWQSAEPGAPKDEAGIQSHLVVIGMGKLGGRELNFSSDIDLIFAYPESGETRDSQPVNEDDAFYTKLCRRLLQVIGGATSDGFVFRTDMRLRPYGESGPIAMSFDSMETYYQLQGRDWERYAWIKARVVAGDKTAGRQLMDRIRPFVYRRYLDFGAFESLRRMKQKIELEEQRKGIENNIKLGPGGIREIEFFGQVFQLIRGGVEPALQRRSIQNVLDTLVQENHISLDVCKNLQNAYIFLRDTENHLQEFSDQQTHVLPTGPLDRERLAISQGFADWEGYKSELDRHLDRVHAHFNKLLVADDSKRDKKSPETRLEAVWQALVDDEQGQEILLGAGFEKPKEAMNLLHNLRNDPATQTLSNEGRDHLDKLVPLILKQTGAAAEPVEILNRIIDLIKTIERRTCYLALLAENPSALVHLVKLSSFSPWIISYLSHHPVLLDELLDPRSLYAPYEKNELAVELHRKLAQIPPRELEYQIEELCIFKQVNTLRVAAADVSGVLPLMRVSDYLSDIAETAVASVVDLAWNHLVLKHGAPACILDDKKCEKGFLVLAYGKFGGLELGYDSDLDLVFLHAGAQNVAKAGGNGIDTAQFFARLGQRVIHLLTAHTAAGTLYEIDMRLRPSGSSGILVSHIEAFGQYQDETAWTWEHQALVRARVIYGDDGLADCFKRIRDQVIARRRDKKKLQQEVCNMRERMRREVLNKDPSVFDLKQGAGGIVDIEFLVQYLVLLMSHKHKTLLNWTDNVRLLGTLAATKSMDVDTAFFLRQTYLTYRLTAHRLSLQNRPAFVPSEKFRDLRQEVIEIWRAYLHPNDHS